MAIFANEMAARIVGRGVAASRTERLCTEEIVEASSKCVSRMADGFTPSG